MKNQLNNHSVNKYSAFFHLLLVKKEKLTEFEPSRDLVLSKLKPGNDTNIMNQQTARMMTHMENNEIEPEETEKQRSVKIKKNCKKQNP